MLCPTVLLKRIVLNVFLYHQEWRRRHPPLVAAGNPLLGQSSYFHHSSYFLIYLNICQDTIYYHSLVIFFDPVSFPKKSLEGEGGREVIRKDGK